jgi:hypothetical protein
LDGSIGLLDERPVRFILARRQAPSCKLRALSLSPEHEWALSLAAIRTHLGGGVHDVLGFGLDAARVLESGYEITNAQQSCGEMNDVGEARSHRPASDGRQCESNDAGQAVPRRVIVAVPLMASVPRMALTSAGCGTGARDGTRREVATSNIRRAFVAFSNRARSLNALAPHVLRAGLERFAR